MNSGSDPGRPEFTEKLKISGVSGHFFFRLRAAEGADREAEIRARESALADLRRDLGARASRARIAVTHAKFEKARTVLVTAFVPETESETLAGLGIDLESALRHPRDGLAEKLVTPWEESFGLDPLEVWVIKEACFKATPENRGLVLSQFEIAWFNSETREGQVLLASAPNLKTLECRFALVRDDAWIAALAIVQSERGVR